MNSKKFGVSLSSGGIKAMLYLGVLNALEESAISIDVLAGSSGGALIAGLYALGKSTAEIQDMAQHLNFLRLYDYNPFDGLEVLNHNHVYAKLKEIVGDARIEDTKIPLLIFTTDIDSKELVVFKEGELAKAMLCSCCLPPLLLPYHDGDRRFVDGGFGTKYGAKYVREMGADIVMGVNLEQWLTDEKIPEPIRSMVQSIRILTHANLNYERQLDPPDLELLGFEDKTLMFDFEKIRSELPGVGYKRMLEVLPELKKLLNSAA